MGQDITLTRAIILIRTLLEDQNNRLETEGISSLEFFRVFKNTFKLSGSTYYYILRTLRALEIIQTSRNEIVLFKPKFNLICKNFPDEYNSALREIAAMKGKGAK